jgi:hypothetical protein
VPKKPELGQRRLHHTFPASPYFSAPSSLFPSLSSSFLLSFSLFAFTYTFLFSFLPLFPSVLSSGLSFCNKCRRLLPSVTVPVQGRVVAGCWFVLSPLFSPTTAHPHPLLQRLPCIAIVNPKASFYRGTVHHFGFFPAQLIARLRIAFLSTQKRHFVCITFARSIQLSSYPAIPNNSSPHSRILELALSSSIK